MNMKYYFERNELLLFFGFRRRKIIKFLNDKEVCASGNKITTYHSDVRP